MGDTRRAIRYLVAAAAAGTAFATAGAAFATTTSTATTAAPQTVALRYSFDAATAGPVDESGFAHALSTVSSHGGAVQPIAHGTGQALQFPTTCGGASCPKVVLQTASADDLNPGKAPFRYGATVLLTHDQTSAGENVVQKGYSATGGQYKLQIDGTA